MAPLVVAGGTLVVVVCFVGAGVEADGADADADEGEVVTGRVVGADIPDGRVVGPPSVMGGAGTWTTLLDGPAGGGRSEPGTPDGSGAAGTVTAVVVVRPGLGRGRNRAGR